MKKIQIEYEIDFDRGDLVLFKKDDITRIGIIESYYFDNGTPWYNIYCDGMTFSYSNGGDIPEWDIMFKLPDEFKDRINEWRALNE